MAAPGLAAIVRQEGRIAACLAGAMVVPCLLFNFVGGNAMAFFVMAMGLCAIVWSVVRRRPIWRPRDQPARMMFLGAYLLVAVAFALTSRSLADFRYAGNFLMFLLFVPISTFLGRFAAPGNLERVTLLALFGAALSLGVGLFQAMVLGQSRVYGIGSDPIWAADAAIVMGFLAAAGCVAAAPLLPRPVFLLGPVFATITVLLTGSRGPSPPIDQILGNHGTRSGRRRGCLTSRASRPRVRGTSARCTPSSCDRIPSIRGSSPTAAQNDRVPITAARIWASSVRA
jgi:hypothetical protein